MTISVSMPGSCGELVQGTIEGVDFHITCPVDRYSHVTAALYRGGGVHVPDGLEKTESAVRKCLETIGDGCGVEIRVASDLARGKGMASSTADIVASIVATHKLFGCEPSLETITKIALSIEPTDGTYFSGIVAFDHRQGRMYEAVGPAPPVEIVVLEPPHAVDTVRFNRDKHERGSMNEMLIKEAFEMAAEGIRGPDIRLLGEAATLSAQLNQSILKKEELDDVVRVCRQKGGAGVNIAHSGTVMGMMAEMGFGQRLFDRVAHYVPRTWNAYLVRMVDGGPRCEDIDPARTRLPVTTEAVFSGG